VAQIRMAHLAIIGSHATNGVAAIHSDLVKTEVFPEFYELWPERFQNKTNGVTPRRWINQANPGLSAVITKWLETDEWKKNLDLLVSLKVQPDEARLRADWNAAKLVCKKRLAARVKEVVGVDIRVDALFDVQVRARVQLLFPLVHLCHASVCAQVKRLHEYKRQLLNALYCIHRYQWIKSLSPEARAAVVPRVVLFGGKAAPGYALAKKIIKLINSIGDKVCVCLNTRASALFFAFSPIRYSLHR
jgi:starch phosphorylase